MQLQESMNAHSNKHRIKINTMFYSSLQKQSETNKLSIRDKMNLTNY